jgi:hypothetical protein
VCSGGNSDHEAGSDIDCNGDCFGEAVVDSCDVCSGGNSGHEADSDQDCTGDCFGSAYIDNCDVCDDDNSNDCVQDCADEWGGDAVFDECGICNGNGPQFECEEGSMVCDESDCITINACDLLIPGGYQTTIHLLDNGSVLYNTGVDIAGFQFGIDGAMVTGASGGAAEDAGFMVTPGGNMVIAFSLTGAVVPAGCGTLTVLTFDGTPTGLTEDETGAIVAFSDSNAGYIDVYVDNVGVVSDCEGIYDCALPPSHTSQSSTTVSPLHSPAQSYIPSQSLTTPTLST